MSWKKLKKGQIDLEVPKINLSELSGKEKAAAENFMALFQEIQKCVREAFKKISQKDEQVMKAIKGLTPSQVQQIAQKECANIQEIPKKLMLLKDNVGIMDFIFKAIAMFWLNLSQIMLAIKEGYNVGCEAIKNKVPPVISTNANSKAPAQQSMHLEQGWSNLATHV